MLMLSLKHFTFIINSEAESTQTGSTCLSFLRDNNLPLPRVSLTLFNYFKCFSCATVRQRQTSVGGFSCRVVSVLCVQETLVHHHTTRRAVKCKNKTTNTQKNIRKTRIVCCPPVWHKGVYFITIYYNEMRKRRKKIIHLFG